MASKRQKPTLFEGLMQGLAETAAYLDGTADKGQYRIHVPDNVDVKTLRRNLHLTQDAFAENFGFSPARVKDWEQERSAPDPAIRAYLTVIKREPSLVAAILSHSEEEYMIVRGTVAPASRRRIKAITGKIESVQGAKSSGVRRPSSKEGVGIIRALKNGASRKAKSHGHARKTPHGHI